MRAVRAETRVLQSAAERTRLDATVWSVCALTVKPILRNLRIT